MRVLGIDPGYARLGYGVTERDGAVSRCITYGVIETTKDLAHSERLQVVYDGVMKLISEFAPVVVSVEELLFQKNVKTALQVAEARGVILLAIKKSGLPIFEIGPKQVKMALTGDGAADKIQVQQLVQRILKLSAVPQPDDAADALAIALTAEQLWQSPW